MAARRARKLCIVLACIGTAGAAVSSFAALPPRPEPPPKSEWGFVRELATPQARTPKERFRLVDDYGCGAALETARADLADFLGGGKRTLRLARGDVDGRESYKVDVSPEMVTLTAGDDEGMRRAIYYFVRLTAHTR